MADIALRAYVKEIDDLIEREKLDEAIAHCRHILQIYPKHLETYRLLGKAYLEAKRYGDAADIFQRVLSAVPDDFVSHVGMAIVREDEGNLDAAIWHMERAFETNPANPAIRQELSRLIGRRDGLEPHKVRLTRGALARQYAQGELFPQAISELRSALQEDPDRPDLEVLLASMYWRAGQAKEAKSVCEQILEKLPFSLEANRILSDLLEKEGQSQRAGELHRKLAALDPYIGFLESVDLEPGTVDANAVRVDHSTWSPGEPLPTAEPGPPEWVTSLGVDLSSDAVSSSPKPAWLSDLDQGPASGRSSTSPLLEPAFDSGEFEGALQDEDAIPEWMREAGWGPSTGEAEEGPVSFSDAELESLDTGNIPAPPTPEETGELAPADIPSWLQDIAPAVETLDDEEAVEAEATPAPLPPTEPLDGGIVPDWLSETAGHPTAESVPEAEGEGISPEAGGEAEGPEVPTWMDSQAPGATSTIISWLGDRDDEGGVQDEAQAIEDLAAGFEGEGSGGLEDFPSWLQDADENLAPGEDQQEQDAEIEGPPSWLAGVAQAASSAPSGVQADMTEAAASSDEVEPEYAETDTSGDTEQWIRRLAEQEEMAAEAMPEQGPDWLSGIGAEPDSEGDAPAEAPSWLSDTGTDQVAESTAAGESNLDAPDWLDGVEEVPPEVPTEQVDVPEWLMGIAEGTGSRSPEPEGDEEEDRTGEFAYDWLGQFGNDAAVETSQSPHQEDLPGALPSTDETSEAESELPAGEAPTPAAGQDLDDDEVFQWLESLAEQQQSTPSESQAPSVGTDQPAQPEVPYSSEAPPDAPDESLRWLEDLAAERGIDVDVGASFEPEPDLRAPAQEAPQVVQPQEPQAEPPETLEPQGSQEDSPDWLREMAASEQTAVEASLAEDYPKPAFTPDLDETIVSQPAEPEHEEVIPGWLDEAAAVAQDVPAEPSTEEAQSAELPPVGSAPPAAERVPEPTPTQTPVAPPQPAQTISPAETPSSVGEAGTEAGPAPQEAQPLEPETPASEPAQPPPPVEEQPSPKVKQPPASQRASKAPPADAQVLLKSARQALAAGDAGRALSDYKKMIERKQDLETVISDLKRALERYPNLPTMWQSLGDAYMKDDQLNEAIKAYQRGMEVA